MDFFFVLSGFLIALLHWDDIGRPARLKRYVARRLTRIYPTYWLILLLIVPLDVFTHTLFDDYGKPLEVLKSVFLLPQDHRILDVTWSLYNELLFYVLFGLMIFNRRLGTAIVAIWITGMLIRPFAPYAASNAWLNALTSPMNVEFLAGAAAGWAFSRCKIDRPVLLLGFGLAIFAVLWVWEDRFWLLNAGNKASLANLPWHQFFTICAAYGLAGSAVVISLSALERQGRIWMPPMLVTLGGASYLLYLVHVPALVIMGAVERVLHLPSLLPAWLIGAAFILIVIAGAIFLHKKLERPLLRAVR